MRRFFLLIITCFILTSAVSDSERVEVKSAENVTLRVERPGNVRLVTLKNCEKRTEDDPIIRYCSPEEEKSGCTAKESDRFSINFDTESLTVTFVDARVSDEGCYVVSYTDVANNVKKKFFNVTVHGSLGNPEEFPIKGPTISLEYLIKIAVGIAFLTVVVILAIIGVINHIINCQKRKQNNAGAGAGDPETIPLNSASSGASKATDESQETVDKTECSLDNNSQREEGAKDLNHNDRKRMTDKTGRTRHCVDSQNNHRG